MIRELSRILVSTALLSAGSAWAQDDEVAKDKVPLPLLYDRVIAVGVRPVVIDWRKRGPLLGVSVGQILELNNFESQRFALSLRMPNRMFVGTLALAGVLTSATPSSELVAKTPYRQAGRPSRLEIDGGVEFPLAEGIATYFWNALPPSQLVFSVQARGRYLAYPQAWKGMSAGPLARTLISTRLSNQEIDNLQEKRPAGMKLDTARINVLVGPRFDLVFKNGVFLNHDVLLNVPLLGGTGLRWWWDISLGGGYAL